MPIDLSSSPRTTRTSAASSPERLPTGIGPRSGEDVTIDYRTPGGTSDIERQLKSTYDAYRTRDGKLPEQISVAIDIVWGGGDYFFDQRLKPAGLLQPMDLDPALLKAAFPDPTLSGVRLYDTALMKDGRPAPQWVGVCLSSFGIIYNPQVYASLGLPEPKVWGDLAGPRLSGFVALADPSHSGSAAVAYMMVIQRAMADAEEDLFKHQPSLKALSKADRAKQASYQRAIASGWKRGMGQLVLIAANARYFADGAEIVPTDVARGDAAAGMAIDFYAGTTEQIVGPSRARFVLPHESTAITPDPVGILAGVTGEQRKLSRQFVEFLLTDGAQRLWALKVGEPGGPTERSLMRTPIRRDVYDHRDGWETLPNPFTEGGRFNQRSEWIGLLSDNVMLWTAAWIDSRDELERAYSVSLRLPASERNDLLAKLADLPVALPDLATMKAERQPLNPDQLDEWRARTQIAWASRFRDHYRAVAKLALGSSRTASPASLLPKLTSNWHVFQHLPILDTVLNRSYIE